MVTRIYRMLSVLDAASGSHDTRDTFYTYVKQRADGTYKKLNRVLAFTMYRAIASRG